MFAHEAPQTFAAAREPLHEEKLGLPPHGYIVSRHELDTHLLDHAEAASARVYRACTATGISRDAGHVRVGIRSQGRHFTLNSRLVVGADGARSIVARSVGLARNDPRLEAGQMLAWQS
jgi:menaquinone-9 beta-reductase